MRYSACILENLFHSLLVHCFVILKCVDFEINSTVTTTTIENNRFSTEQVINELWNKGEDSKQPLC